MCARTQSCVYFIFWPEFSLQVASSTWTTNMLRLDPTFNADLPESKRWLKEYGARENEAFRCTGFFLYCTSHWATYYEGYKTDMCEIAPVSTSIAESTQCQPRRATDVAPWRTPPSSSLFDIHLTDWSPPTSTRCPFESRSFTCLSVVFVFAWLWVRLAFVLSCSILNMIWSSGD